MKIISIITTIVITLSMLVAPHVQAMDYVASTTPTKGNDASIHPGEEITLSSGNSCTVGAVTQKGGMLHILTAGHCGDEGDVIAAGGFTLRVVQSINNGIGKQDTLHAMGQGVGTNTMPVTGGKIRVKGASRPKVGQVVCSLGANSGWKCGKVTMVEGVSFATDFCVYPGDSGSPVITEEGALLGIVSAGIHAKSTTKKCKPNDGGFNTFVSHLGGSFPMGKTILL